MSKFSAPAISPITSFARFSPLLEHFAAWPTVKQAAFDPQGPPGSTISASVLNSRSASISCSRAPKSSS